MWLLGLQLHARSDTLKVLILEVGRTRAWWLLGACTDIGTAGVCEARGTSVDVVMKTRWSGAGRPVP